MIMRKHDTFFKILSIDIYQHVLSSHTVLFTNRSLSSPFDYAQIAEPQLMLTAGPGMMAAGYAPQNVYATPAQNVYASNAAAYQGYGM